MLTTLHIIYNEIKWIKEEQMNLSKEKTHKNVLMWIKCSFLVQKPQNETISFKDFISYLVYFGHFMVQFSMAIFTKLIKPKLLIRFEIDKEANRRKLLLPSCFLKTSHTVDKVTAAIHQNIKLKVI